ncbi:hypothetical protein DyAD56_09245 [Dyella sp. AD56]|uniref:hypothetical protein n=1 Tax=Dyella sp. AD56 TaxID=1528744 RepID=UPI000CB2FB49|nr:hypothetical protein [Dyella sp. AD56]PMQ05504.1 hypothetical protein DyAD56_09245 [Dyella sp. AD56]
MRKTLGSPLLRRLPALLAFTLLVAACGKPTDDHATAASPPADTQGSADASNANELAESTAKCESNPLTKAMPPKSVVGDLPFWYWHCTFNTLSAVYGTDGGKQVEIMLTDTRPPELDKESGITAETFKQAADGTRSLTQLSVQNYVETRKLMEQQPSMVEVIGGPDYMPIIETGPAGEPIVIYVGAKISPSEDAVSALLKDRYVLAVQARDKEGRSATGMTAPQAQALYDPYLKQMHLDVLQ